MDDVLIKVENVSKKYCKSLRKSMVYGMQDITRNVLGLSSQPGKLRKKEFWAVEDASFELKKGETLGLIGANGAGKTTLLKMLNGIFWPDKGKITINGKVGALIEVGAGFHPMLTGRENVYVNGAILGMSKKEIDEKFSSIIEFADIGDFIDAPVKNYSSGMYVRLGFAVAVHCEPEILLVDEVLAVGDSAFRNKCYQKLNALKKNDVAIVFVSHDLFTVEKFCDKGMFINKGIIESQGEVRKVIQDYQSAINQSLQKRIGVVSGMSYGTKEIEITNVKILDKNSKEQNTFSLGDTLRIRVEYEAKNTFDNPRFQISIWSWDSIRVSVFGPHLDGLEMPCIKEGKGTIECQIDKLPLLTGNYYVNIGIYDESNKITFDWWGGDVHPSLSFHILPNRVSAMMGQYTGICHFDSKWLINEKQLELETRANF